jgi:serralysin
VTVTSPDQTWIDNILSMTGPGLETSGLVRVTTASTVVRTMPEPGTVLLLGGLEPVVDSVVYTLPVRDSGITPPETGDLLWSGCADCGGACGGHAVTASGITTQALSGPKATPDQMATYLTTGFWNDKGERPHSWDTSGSNVITVDLSGVNAEMKALIRAALDAWEAVADLQFKEVSGNGDITFTANGSGATNTSVYETDGDMVKATVIVSQAWVDANGSTVGSYSMQTYMHEIGHALGLGHSGGYGFPGGTTYSNDTWQMSVMSYNSQDESTAIDASTAVLVTPMAADIIAVQNLYGAPSGGVTAGNTVYGVKSDIGTYLDSVFAGNSGSLSKNAMTIYDESGRDKIDFSSDTKAQRVDLNASAYSDVYGKKGNLGIAKNTTIEDYVAGSGADIVTGNGVANSMMGMNGDDDLRGSSGNDNLNGGAGNDKLDGGSGKDTLLGGAGNDTFVVDATGDQVFETTSTTGTTDAGGQDTVKSTITFNIGARPGVQFVENLTLTGSGHISATGNSRDNLIVGNSGNNVLNGGAGNDTLNSNDGTDSLFGGDGDDQLNAGASDDVVQGGNGNDAVYGGDGNDTLNGDAGNDTLNGNAGRDFLAGGAGNDTFNTDAGDTISEASGQGTDLVQSSVSYTLGANLENLTLTGSGAINGTGNSLSNTIIGNAAANTITGASGSDTLTGGKGSDSFVFNAALGSGNIDKITDFNVTADTMRLEGSVFTGLADGPLVSRNFEANTSGEAGNTSVRIIYEIDTGRLFYDADGKGGVAKVQFASVGSNLALTSADFIVF